MDISERIKLARKKNGLTQKDLAKKTGLSIASIQGYEQGKYKPKIEQIDKIASALGVQIIDLMEHYTLDQYKKTKEFQKHMKEGDAIEDTNQKILFKLSSDQCPKQYNYNKCQCYRIM